MKAWIGTCWLALALALRDLPSARPNTEVDEPSVTSPTADEPLPCQVARRVTAWHYKLDYSVATSVDLSNRYVVRADEFCIGDDLAHVVIMPEIDPIRPLDSSSASLLFESREDPFTLPETSYVCEALSGDSDQDLVSWPRGCVAVLKNVRPLWGPRMLLHSIPSSPFQSKLEDDTDPATRLGLDILAVLMLTVALLTLLVLCHLLIVIILLCRNRTTSVSFRRSESDAVQVQSPWSDLKSGCLQVTAYVFSVITLQGICLHLSSKNASDFVLLMVLFWPCTFGMAGIMRMFQTLCHAQLVHAALANGVCIQGGVPSFVYDVVIALGAVVLAFSIVFSLTTNNLGRTAILSAIGTAIGFYIGPTVTMGKALVSVARTDKAIRTTQFPVSLAGLTKVVVHSTAPPLPEDPVESGRGRLQSASTRMSSLPSTTSASGSVDQKLRDGELRFMHLHTVMQQCRRGHDPLEEPDEAADTGSESMSAFGMTDFFRHGRIIHQLTGSVAGYLMVPVIVVFLLGLFANTACRSVMYLTGPPELLELTTTNGHMVPKFQPRQQRYAVILDSHWGNVGVFARADAYSTRYLNYSVPDTFVGRHFGGVDGSVKLINVDTSRAPFPHFAAVTVTGARGMTRSYVINFLPAKTLATSVRLRAGTFMRCIPWSSVPGAAISIPDELAEEKLKVDIALTDYMLRVPVNHHAPGLRVEVATVWYPVKPASSEICQEICRYDASCLDAVHGIDGCYFASSPFNADTCHLAHVGQSRYGRRHWLLRQATGRLQTSNSDLDYSQVKSDRHWRLSFPGVVPEWVARQTELVFRLFLSSSEQEVATEVQTMLLHRGTTAPLEILVQVMSNGTSYGQKNYMPPLVLGATVEMLDSTQVLVTLPEYNVTSMGDELAVIVAPLMRDFAFEVQWINTTGSSMEVVEDKSAWPAFKRCVDVSALQRYDVCGGTWKSDMGLLRVNSWQPNQKAYFNVVGKLGYDFFFQPLTMVVHIQGYKGREPAEWMVRKDCQLPGDKIMNMNLLTPPVTCSALQNCEHVGITNLPSVHTPFDRHGLLQRALWKFGMTDSRDAAKLLLCSRSMTASQRLAGWGLCTECENLPCLCMRPWSMAAGRVIRLPMRVLVEESRPRDGRFLYFFCRKFWGMKSGPVKRRFAGAISLQLWDEVLTAAVRSGSQDILKGLSFCLRRVHNSPMKNLSGAVVPEAMRVAVAQRRSEFLQPLMEAWTGYKSPAFRKELLSLAVRAHCLECLDTRALKLETFRMLSFEEELPELAQTTILAAALQRMPALESLSVQLGWSMPREGVVEVVKALMHLKELTFLAIPSAVFCGELMNALCQALKAMPHLKSFRLDRSDMTDHDAIKLAAALGELPAMSVLQLQGNKIGRVGAEALILALRNCPTEGPSGTIKRKVLDLTGNPLNSSDQELLQAKCGFCTFNNMLPDLPSPRDIEQDHVMQPVY